MDNKSQQQEELEVLKAIFDEEWTYQQKFDCYCMRINKNTELTIKLNPDYPSDRPPKYELLAPLISSHQRSQIEDEFRNIYESEKGGPIIFQWIERLKEIVSEVPLEENCNFNGEKFQSAIVERNIKVCEEFVNRVTHGTCIQDRKSTFQGHACRIYNQDDVRNFMEYLLRHKKVSQAKHNISAYRIVLPNSRLLQDCDDDGETAAGGRLLHLLQILNVENVMVVVTRWYGGIHLGPDRFKHINNAARQVLIQSGIIK